MADSSIHKNEVSEEIPEPAKRTAQQVKRYKTLERKENHRWSAGVRSLVNSCPIVINLKVLQHCKKQFFDGSKYCRVSEAMSLLGQLLKLHYLAPISLK